jgi:hypothetical protein
MPDFIASVWTGLIGHIDAHQSEHVGAKRRAAPMHANDHDDRPLVWSRLIRRLGK